MGFLTWLKESPPILWARGSDWPYPILLCLHAVGMATLVGIAIVVALRTFGAASGIPVAALERPMRLAWAGFLVNAASGVLLFTLDGPAYMQNAAFLIKMGLVFAGGLCLFALWRTLRAQPVDAPAPGGTRVLAAITLAIWAGAIISGRLIAYVMDAGR